MRFFKTPLFKILGVLVLTFIFYQECFVKNNKDFDIFIGASQLVFEGKNCYEVWLKSGAEGLRYFYSPLFAVLLFPVKDLPQVAYNFVWTGINLFFICRIFKLLPFFLPLNRFSENKRTVFVLLLFLLTTRYMLDNLDLGQMTFLLVWASMESMRLVYEKKYLTGSALLALIINIKLIPLAFVFYLLYKREFRAVLLTTAFFILYLFLPAIFIGPSFNNELLQNWFHSLSGTTVHSIHDDAGRPSLSSLIPSLLMDTPLQFDFKRNILNLPEGTVNTILNSIRFLILLILTLLFGKPFQTIKNKKKLFYDLSLVCLTTPLIFPHQGKYSFFYLLPAYAYCLYSIIKLKALQNKLKSVYQLCKVLLIISFCLVTLTTDGLIGRKASNFTEYLHLISYGSMILLIALIFLKPKTILRKLPDEKDLVL